MLRDGMAQVYESSYGSEFGKERERMEPKYRAAEGDARGRKVGIWGLKGKYESPGQYKARIAGKDLFTPSIASAATATATVTGEKVKGKRGVSSSSSSGRSINAAKDGKRRKKEVGR